MSCSVKPAENTRRQTVHKMEFQRLLLEAGKALSNDEIRALAFLCTDLVSRNLASVDSASNLFSLLADQDLLSAEEPYLLTELLVIIQRSRLIRDLNLTNLVSQMSLISPYRKLLYNLSEELTDADLKSMKFLLNKKLPRKKLEDNVTTLEVFLEMEHMDLIRDTDLDLLESIIQQVCPMLIEKINQFKAQQGVAVVPHSSPITQETGRPRSKSYPVEPNQVSLSRGTTLLSVSQELQPLAVSTMSTSNTSMDFPDQLHSGHEFEALSRGLRVLNTETSSCGSLKVKSDASVMSQENETFSGQQMSQTTNEDTDLEIYPMASAKRGICLIVNNYDFTKSQKYLQNREGTMVDEKCLQRVFEWLGFEVVVWRDCESKKMQSVMQELGHRDHSQMDCLVCCILSHGEEGCVYGVDGNTVTIRELTEPLNGLNCYTLAGKPKLFFIQACQGKDNQRAVYIEADGPARLVHSDATEIKESIPSEADFLLGMSTVPSFVSYRERTNGTWYIQTLCKNLVQMVPSGSDLVSILTKVNADVSKKADASGSKKQMPQPAFTLTKKVVFPVLNASRPAL